MNRALLILSFAALPFCLSAESGASTWAQGWVSGMFDVSGEPISCALVPGHTLLLVEEYDRLVANSDKRGADEAYEKLRSFVFDEIGEQSPCFVEYGLEVIALETIKPSNQDRIQEHVEPQSRRAVGDINTQVITQAVAVLMDSGKFVFLTHKKRQELGGQWLEKTPGTGEYSAIGAYDCATSTVYVDPYLRPFDLATTIYHEMDHFVRDKTVLPLPQSTANSELFTSTSDSGIVPPSVSLSPTFFGANSNPSALNWTLYNLADETAAMLDSRQRQMSLQSYVMKGTFQDGLYFDVRHYLPKKGYNYEKDLTFLSKGGPIADFKKTLVLGFHGNDELPPGWVMGGILSERAIELAFQQQGQEKLLAKAQDLRSQIFATIGQAYFPNQKIVYPNGMDADHFFDFNFETAFNLATANQVPAWISGPSPMCKAYMDSITHGELDQYLGVRFNTESGSGAVKASVRPCLSLRTRL